MAMEAEFPAELVEDICQLARGPARPVLEEAAREWLERHKQALRAGRHPRLPYPADQSDPYSPDPKQPLPMPDFGAGCAVLAAVHDQNCARCVALWPPPTAHEDPVGHALWKMLRKEVIKKPDPAYVRKMLDSVRMELGKQGALPSGAKGDDSKVLHSDDFRSVVWLGTPYTFTKNQAACVKVLWEAWTAGTPELEGLTVVTRADVAQTRLIDVFRSKGKAHSAWGTMIVQGTSKGAYRLNDRPAVTPPKARQKGSRKTTRKTHR